MRNKMKHVALAVGVFALKGCTSYAEKFDCAPGMGVGCKSLTYVNRMVEKGRLPLDEEEVSAPKASLRQPVEQAKSSDLKVWMAGHEDEEGHYHEETYVHIKE